MGDVLTVNAGSTSMKLHTVDHRGEARVVAGFDDVDPTSLEAVAHRVVHTGGVLVAPTLIDDATRDVIASAVALAPMHNEPALAAIDTARMAFPQLPHAAVLDSTFHLSMAQEVTTYPVPLEWRELGIRRYGFHGLSVEWSAERAPWLLGRPHADLRLVVCHLGGGSSVTAVHGGHSVDTTMGFSPLDGLPMATRCGAIDPGALLYLLREKGVGVDDLEETLNTRSGLAAIAGRGGDMSEITLAAAAGDADAQLAQAVYCHRVAGAVAQMAAAMGGIDAVAFTAGIGERSAAIRADVCARLGFLGLTIDSGRNAFSHGDRDIGADISRARVLVIRAREELILARTARRLLPTP